MFNVHFSSIKESTFQCPPEQRQQLMLGELLLIWKRDLSLKLAHKGSSPIDQIQLSLGHDSIQTTKYLGVEQDLTDAPCDHLGIGTSG